MSAKIIRDAGIQLDGSAQPGNGYLVTNGATCYRVYQRLDGLWSYVGLLAWGRGFATEATAHNAAKSVYGF